MMNCSVSALLVFFLAPFALRAADDYQPGPDSLPQAGVPQGAVERFELPVSRVFPGASHECHVYIPAQYNAAKPASLMVFQDGGGYLSPDGPWRAPVVFDNLIARGAMPVTIGVFINPGVLPAVDGDALPRFNRSLEYDGLGDAYVRFLTGEVLPGIKKKWNITDDPNQRAIAGASSGAIAAFTAAWERPDAFRRVFSTIGTYVGLRGGDQYHTLIRKYEPRPLRVFLQDGSGDQNIYGGDWWIANQQMLSALTFSGYQVNHVWGDGGHNGKQGGAVMPQALQWLWQEKEVATPVNDRQPVMKVIVPGAGWEVAGEVEPSGGSPAAAANGEVFFAGGGGQRIYRTGLDGRTSIFAENAGGAAGLGFGPDGRLYACCRGERTIAAWNVASGERQVIAGGVDGYACAVSHRGDLWFTDQRQRRVYQVKPGGTKTVVSENQLELPGGIALSPDQSLLYVADSRGRFVWSWQIQPDGSAAHGQRYFHLHEPDDGVSGVDGLALDTAGRLYAGTPLGIQFCDQAGRVNGILQSPPDGLPGGLCFGGEKRDTLFVCAGSKVYRRRTQVTGVRAADAPQKPAPPRL